MASAFSDSLMASGGDGSVPLRSRGLQKVCMTMKFLPDVGVYKEAWNQKKNFDITGLVCKLQTKILKNPIFGNATSRHAKILQECQYWRQK